MSPGFARRVQVHGHRGARAIYSENTIAAFQYAIDAGVDALEMDVVVTKDNVLVVSHDPFINPEICQGPHCGTAIRALMFAQLREYDCGSLKNPRFPAQRTVPGARIPALTAVLALVEGTNVQLDIELKSVPGSPELTPAPEEFASLLVAEIRAHRLEARIAALSFDFRILHEVRRRAPELKLAALWEKEAGPFESIAREADADILCPEYSLVTSGEVRRSHQLNLPVVPWTANSPESWEQLIAAGVDGIVTDDPAGLIAYLKAEGLREN